MGKLRTFDITFDRPYAVYAAGDVVRGKVVVDLSEAMNMRSLRLCMLGRSKVHWIRTKAGQNSRTVHYRAEETYFDHKVILFGNATESSTMQAGLHQFPFELPLSIHLPSSFEGRHGYIRYLCTATIDKPWKFDHVAKTAFTVLSILDLNMEPSDFRMAMQGEDQSEVSCCCISGTVHVLFRINRRCFVPGQPIIIYAEVENGSNSKIKGMKATLKQILWSLNLRTMPSLFLYLIFMGLLHQIGAQFTEDGELDNTTASIQLSANISCTEEIQNFNPNHILCRESHENVTNTGVSEEDQEYIVDTHNKCRESADPSAETMYRIYWDEKLAVLAQKAADICHASKFHLENDVLPEHAASTYGENLAFGYNSWEETLDAWIKERNAFTLGKGGRRVGHYTQMVRDVVGRIGCGYAECPGRVGKAYVCKYIYGQPDVKNPYVAGTPCSKCKDRCVNNTCDCEGKMCFNFGGLDWETCSCTCTRAFTGPTCEIPKCETQDYEICTSEEYSGNCEAGNWANYCPHFCKACPS